MIRIFAILMGLISLLSINNIAFAGTTENGWNEAGIRVGFQDGSRNEYFRQYDAFAVYGLPWEWRNDSGWGAATNLEISAGALQGGDEIAFLAAVGPRVSINKHGKGLALDLGISIDIIDRCRFVRQNFGGNVLFGAYMGLSYLFENGIKIGYRVVHISNGKIFYPNGTPNPGLDTHVAGVSWNF